MLNFAPHSATEGDIAGIQRLLNHYASMGELLPRSKSDLLTNLQSFLVIKNEQTVIACGSLEHFTPALAEIRSLMVDTEYKQHGLGRKIVEQLIDRARNNSVQRLMALTYVPEFFHRLGFRTVDKEIFPEKVWGICVNCYKFDNCDEIAVLLELN